jgi:hypothetical protein
LLLDWLNQPRADRAADRRQLSAQVANGTVKGAAGTV